MGLSDQPVPALMSWQLLQRVRTACTCQCSRLHFSLGSQSKGVLILCTDNILGQTRDDEHALHQSTTLIV